MESQHTFSRILKAFIPKGIERESVIQNVGILILCIVVAIQPGPRPSLPQEEHLFEGCFRESLEDADPDGEESLEVTLAPVGTE